MLDPAIYVTFPLVSDPTVKFVAWTTTPWTLPSNLALSVNPTMSYVKIRDFRNNEIYIVAEDTLASFFSHKIDTATEEEKPEKKTEGNTNPEEVKAAENAPVEAAKEEPKEKPATE